MLLHFHFKSCRLDRSMRDCHKHECWVYLLTLTTAGKHPSSRSLDLQIAVCQLAVEVLTKLPKGIRKKQASKAAKLSQIAKSRLPGSGKDATEGLWEVIEGLEEMNI